MKVGIVLAGGMGKGAYEIGCVKAIAEKFSREEIVCVSASSIGSLVAYSFVSGQIDKMIETLKAIDVRSTGHFFPSLASDANIFEKIRNAVLDENICIPRTYSTVWNYTKRSIEYVPIHDLSKRETEDYLCASVAIPIFNKGIRINECTHFDGAFIDNIPVFPLLETNIDIIFCIYFDRQNYIFENESFDKKIIKLYDFPAEKKWENFYFDPNKIDSMVDYGYKYTKSAIDEILHSDSLDDIYERIRKRNFANNVLVERRFTCDIIMTNVNKMTSKFAKRKIQ